MQLYGSNTEEYQLYCSNTEEYQLYCSNTEEYYEVTSNAVIRRSTANNTGELLALLLHIKKIVVADAEAALPLYYQLYSSVLLHYSLLLQHCLRITELIPPHYYCITVSLLLHDCLLITALLPLYYCFTASLLLHYCLSLLHYCASLLQYCLLITALLPPFPSRSHFPNSPSLSILFFLLVVLNLC